MWQYVQPEVCNNLLRKFMHQMAFPNRNYSWSTLCTKSSNCVKIDCWVSIRGRELKKYKKTTNRGLRQLSNRYCARLFNYCLHYVSYQSKSMNKTFKAVGLIVALHHTNRTADAPQIHC